MDNPRYEAQNLTLKGFFETGIWVIARIMLLPSLIFAGFLYFGLDEGVDPDAPTSKAFAPAFSALDSLKTSMAAFGGGRSSSGRTLGFGVGSAPAGAGAKWVRPGSDSTPASTGAKWVSSDAASASNSTGAKWVRP